MFTIRRLDLLARCHARRFASATALPDYVIKVPFPALSPTMEQGSIAKWRLEEGGTMEPGDVLCEIETDKATVDFEVQDDGVLAKILYPEGTQDIIVGSTMALLVEDEAELAEFNKCVQ